MRTEIGKFWNLLSQEDKDVLTDVIEGDFDKDTVIERVMIMHRIIGRCFVDVELYRWMNDVLNEFEIVDIDPDLQVAINKAFEIFGDFCPNVVIRNFRENEARKNPPWFDGYDE